SATWRISVLQPSPRFSPAWDSRRGAPNPAPQLVESPFRYRAVGPDSSDGGLKLAVVEPSTVVASPGTVSRPSMLNHSAVEVPRSTRTRSEPAPPPRRQRA